MHQLVLVSISEDEEVLDGGNVMMEKGLFPCKLIFFDGVDSMKLQSREKKTRCVSEDYHRMEKVVLVIWTIFDLFLVGRGGGLVDGGVCS